MARCLGFTLKSHVLELGVRATGGFLLLLLVVVGPSAQAQLRVLRSVGVSQTGPNYRCGGPIWVLDGIPVGPESYGSFLGLENTEIFGSGAPTVTVSAADCDGTTGRLEEHLLTHYDDNYGFVRGWPAPDETLEGRTLSQVPVPAGSGVRAPIPVPHSVPPNPLPPTRDLITGGRLGDWMAAGGDAEITCDDATGDAVIAARIYNLIAGGVYTVFGHWAQPDGTELVAPFGGLPNTVVADKNGNADFCRAVDHCPLDLTPNSSSLQFFSLSYMGDGISYGLHPYEAFETRAFLGVAPLPFLSTIPGGIVSFEHVGFRVNATGGPDPGPFSPALCTDSTPTVASFPMGPLGLVGALAAIGGLAIRRRR